jgi:hypothetical protein
MNLPSCTLLLCAYGRFALLQFGRLERVEVGGTKGKSLTSAIKQVHTDFLAAHEKFQQVRLRPQRQSVMHSSAAARTATGAAAVCHYAAHAMQQVYCF